jgi:hypothetical protein
MRSTQVIQSFKTGRRAGNREEVSEAPSSLRIAYEYDSRTGNDGERAAGARQLILDKNQWFGFTVTLMERVGT